MKIFSLKKVEVQLFFHQGKSLKVTKSELTESENGRIRLTELFVSIFLSLKGQTWKLG